MLFREGKADRESQRQIFLFAAEKTGVLRPLWLVGGQVLGSIFPCGKNRHPAARAATLTAHILPAPTASPKTEADSRANQPPVFVLPVYGENRRRYMVTDGRFYAGCSPCTPASSKS